MCNKAWTRLLCAGVTVLAFGACRAPGADHDAIRSAAEAHGGEITVAGCLQQSEETGGLLLVNAVLANERAGFPVREGVPPPETMIGTTGSTRTIPATVRGPRYTLEPPRESGNLQEHVGRQVQVTGSLAGPSDGEPVGTSGEDAAAAQEEEADGHIRAEEVRLIAAACM